MKDCVAVISRSGLKSIRSEGLFSGFVVSNAMFSDLQEELRVPFTDGISFCKLIIVVCGSHWESVAVADQNVQRKG